MTDNSFIHCQLCGLELTAYTGALICTHCDHNECGGPRGGCIDCIEMPTAVEIFQANRDL